MAYSNLPIGTSNPGCIVILVDQSWSMSGNYGTGTKIEVATLAVNGILSELVAACQAGDVIKDRCRVSVISYGERVECVVDGMISEVASSVVKVKRVTRSISDGAGGVVEVEMQIPIWVQPAADNGTPMHLAFKHASEIVQRWCAEPPDGFPPIVINVTDGEANYPDLTAEAAKTVTKHHTTDGSVLLFNIHIADNMHTVTLPHSTVQLVGDNFAEFLFDISSVLPEPLHEAAKTADFSIEHNARCFTYNADPVTMIKILNFGSLGLMVR